LLKKLESLSEADQQWVDYGPGINNHCNHTSASPRPFTLMNCCVIAIIAIMAAMHCGAAARQIMPKDRA